MHVRIKGFRDNTGTASPRGWLRLSAGGEDFVRRSRRFRMLLIAMSVTGFGILEFKEKRVFGN